MRRFYVDGIQVNEGAWTASVADSNPLVIGFDINRGFEQLHFSGSIDDVRLYNRGLDEDEVMALVNVP